VTSISYSCQQIIQTPDTTPPKKNQQKLCTIDQIDLTDNYRILHRTAVEYRDSSKAHGTFYKTDHILKGHRTSLKYKKEIGRKKGNISWILLDHNELKLERKTIISYTNERRLNTFLED
jgi:hypothetical protein